MRKNSRQAIEAADLADDARALMEATANLTGQKVKKARKRLALALEHGKKNGNLSGCGSHRRIHHRISSFTPCNGIKPIR